VRRYNASATAERRIHVLGFDAQMTEPAATLLVERRDQLDLSQREADLLGQLAADHGKRFTAMGASDRRALAELLGRLGDGVRSVDPRTTQGRAAIAARSLRHQLGYLSEPNWVKQGRMRDEAMADLAAFVIERGGRGSGCLLAHNGHVARERSGGTETMGQFLAERLGDNYYPIGFFSYEGSARAWDAAGEIGVIAHQLAPTPAYNMESAIMAATGFADVAWVDIATLPAALRQWLELPRFSREFGSGYFGAQDAQALRHFPRAFEALVVVRHASASTPTPTGERRVVR
jgi:erythromycin esterase-like protein